MENTVTSLNQRAIGRRKTAVAVVNLQKGNGKIMVNHIPHTKYFFDQKKIKNVEAPLALTGLTSAYDLNIKVEGGGISGQSDAIRLGIARALIKINPELKKSLRESGYITRDSRVKERKKFGKYGARRSPQFTKR